MHTAHLPHLQQPLSNNNRFTACLSHQTTQVLLLLLLFVGGMVGEGWGQSPTNGGFESNGSITTTPTSWSVTGTTTTTNPRTGIYALISNSSKSISNVAHTNTSTISVANNGYAHVIAWAKGLNSSSNASVGGTLNVSTSSTVTSNIGTTLTQLTYNSAQNTSGITQNFSCRVNSRSSAGTATQVYFDDVIMYTDATTAVDIVKPTAASSFINGTTGSGFVSFSWTNGSDAATGIQNSIVLRTTNLAAATPVMNDQGIYSIAGGTSGPNTVTTDWTVLSTSVLSSSTSYTDATVSPATSYKYAIIHVDLAFNYSTSLVSGTITTPSGGSTSPTLIAASGATVDGTFVVTFTEDALWRGGITGITVDGSTLSPTAYSITSGQVTFTPSLSTLLQSAGSKSIVVNANGYTSAPVNQVISVGAANKLTITTQPNSPTINGASLAAQPVVAIQDQYSNATTSTANVSAAVGAGTWTVGGTTNPSSISGTATFSDLTATSAASITGATIAFTSSGLTSATSNTFNIPAPVTANDDCSNAIAITLDVAAITGTNVSATKSSPTTFTASSSYTNNSQSDVWYIFTASCTGNYTITATPTTSLDIVIAAFGGGSCPNPTYISYIDANTTGIGASFAETLTISAVAGTTYRVMLYGFNGATGSYTISVASSVTPQFTLANTGTPSAANRIVGASNVALFGFGLTPTACTNSFDFTAASVTTSGTVTTTDLSNFRLIVDVNNDGVADAGEIAAPIATVSILSNPLVFSSISGQTGLSSVKRYLLIADIISGATPTRTFTASLTNANTTASVTVIGSASGNAQTILGVTPTLTAAFGATVDNAFDVTFTDNSAWRSTITSITVGGTILTTGYTVSTGKITFNSATSAPASLLQSSGSKSIVVIATGYANATITQSMGFGAAVQLTNNTAPIAPASNGAVLATQPKVNIADLYGNVVTSDNSTVVTVAATQGTWTLGGTLTATATSGVAIFSGLTATSAATVTGATLTYTSSPSLGTLASGTFNINGTDYINLTNLGIAVSENFNSMSTSGTASLPQGFKVSASSPDYTSGSSTTTLAYGNTGTGAVASTSSGGVINWADGATVSATDRSLGFITTGSFTSPNSIILKIYNNTGSTVSSLNIGFDYEKYRSGSRQYNWTFFHGSTTNPTISATSGDQSYAADAGNTVISNPALTTNKIVAISGLNILNNSAYYLKWTYTGLAGSSNSQGIGIDNFSLNACSVLPATSNLLASVLSNPIAGNAATVTVSSTTLATGTYIVTYNVSGTNIVSNTTASMSFTAGSSGTGTFITSSLSTAGSANVVNIIAIAFSSVTGCPITVSTSTAAFSTLDATLTLSNNNLAQISTQNLTRNTSNNPISRFTGAVTNVSATLSSVTFITPNSNTTNSYVGGTDINNFKLWYNTTNTFSGATQLGIAQTSVNNNIFGGETVNFSGLTTSLPVNTYYFFITGDILTTATSGRTITVNAPTLTLSIGTVVGNTTATGTQTIIAGVATNYYLQNSMVGTASSWNAIANGSGSVLSSIAVSDVNLIIDGIANAAVTSDLTLGNGSKLIVGQSSAAQLTISNNVSVTSTIDVGAFGTLVINNGINPALGTVNANSTVVYNFAGNQTATASASYGNITLGGSGIKILANVVTLSGTLTILSGVTLDATNTTLSGAGNVIVQSGATLIIGAIGGLNGFNGTSGSSIYSSSANYTFNGTAIQVFGAAFPIVVNDLTISNANQAMALNASQIVNGTLTLASGKLSIGSNILTLNGTFSGTAANSLIGSTSSNLTIGGSGVFGTLYLDQTSNITKTLKNIVINRTTSGTVSLGNGIRVVGELTPTAGVLTTGGNLRLLSSAIGTSAAIGIGSSSGGYISGTVDVERFSQAQRGYRTFAHPYTTAQSVSQLTDNFQITGLASGALGSYGVSTGTPSALYYDGTKTAGATSVLGRITSSTSTDWAVGKGLYVFVRGNGNEGSGGTYTSGTDPNGVSKPSGISSVTLDVTNASINQGDITVSLIPYAVGQDNFTLVGNPYPCAINLSGVIGIGSFGTIYIFNPTLSGSGTTIVRGGFEATNNNNIVIPSMGCFYIQSTSGTPTSITFHESDKVPTTGSSYALFGGNNVKQPKIVLNVNSGDGFMDRTTIGFEANSVGAFVDFYDATKLGNNLFTFYSLSSDNKALAIDYRNTASTDIIPLGIQTSIANHYTISLSELTDLPNTKLVLKDKLLNVTTPLNQEGDSYSFDITADAATKGDNRFEIALLGTTLLPTTLTSFTAQLQASNNMAVNWTTVTEVNADYYQVQRSINGNSFTSIGQVAATGASTYTYLDYLSSINNLPPSIYYRLQMVDKDGSISYSKVVSCQLQNGSKALFIYPNPVEATLIAQVTESKASKVMVVIRDLQGKQLSQQTAAVNAGITTLSVDATSLAAGSYVLVITNSSGEQQQQQFVKK